MSDLVSTSIEEATPVVRLRWWERAIQPTLGFFTYHAIHHHHPGIPWHRLSRAERVYEREGLVDEHNTFQGAWRYLGSLVRHRRRAVPDANTVAPAPGTPS